MKTLPENHTTTTMTIIEAVRHFSRCIRINSWNHWGSHHITPTQRHTLEFLSSTNEGDSTPTAIADALGITRATVNDCVKAMNQKGLVILQRAPFDGRMVIVTLTKMGKKLLMNFRLIPDPLSAAISALSKNEQRTYLLLTVKLIEAYSVTKRI